MVTTCIPQYAIFRLFISVACTSSHFSWSFRTVQIYSLLVISLRSLHSTVLVVDLRWRYLVHRVMTGCSWILLTIFSEWLEEKLSSMFAYNAKLFQRIMWMCVLLSPSVSPLMVFHHPYQILRRISFRKSSIWFLTAWCKLLFNLTYSIICIISAPNLINISIFIELPPVWIYHRVSVWSFYYLPLQFRFLLCGSYLLCSRQNFCFIFTNGGNYFYSAF